MAFSPDGARLAAASWDGNVKLWSTKTGREVRTLRGHGSVVNSVAFTGDGRLVTGSLDGTVKVWSRIQENQNDRT
jgi:WD40 repeat protein